MKLVLLVCVATLVAAEESNSSAKAIGYHQRFGIPKAEKIRMTEAVASRIMGGMASFIGENPYLAGLIITLSGGQLSVCAGTLLNRRKVLTAAHCWYDGYLQGKKITVVLGSTSLFSGGERQNAYSIVVHPQYNPLKLVNDLAILTIPGVSYSSSISPAFLPVFQPTSTFVGVTAKAVGYGFTSNKDTGTASSLIQHGVYVTVISNKVCDALHYKAVDSNMICTSGANKWGPCNGDMGAPLIYSSYPGENLLIGVFSFHSSNGCDSELPFGFMRVTAYLTWIQNHLF